MILSWAHSRKRSRDLKKSECAGSVPKAHYEPVRHEHDATLPQGAQ
jgi:hypothetical protein